MPPCMTTCSASCRVSLLARLGTKPIAPRSIERITSALRSEAETTTTGTAGQELRSSISRSKPSASPRRRSSSIRSNPSASAASASRAALALLAPTTETCVPMPSITFCRAVRISGWSSISRTFMAVSNKSAPHGFGDADRLIAALALHEDLERELRAAFDRLEPEELEAAAHPAAGGHRRREAHSIQAVVDTHSGIEDLHRRSTHLGQQGQGHEAVRDRRAERAGLRPLDIDMDPLVVVGRVGE